MNIETFRKDLKEAIANKGVSQSDLASMSGVRQGTLSKFLNPNEKNGRRERDMKLSIALRLWPFVYGDGITPATPATSPSQLGGGDAA